MKEFDVVGYQGFRLHVFSARNKISVADSRFVNCVPELLLQCIYFGLQLLNVLALFL